MNATQNCSHWIYAAHAFRYPLGAPSDTACSPEVHFYSCRSACNRSQRSRNCLAAGHNEIFCIGAAWVSSLCSLFSTSFECFDWSCRRSHKYAAALLCTNDGKGLSIQFLLLFIHKAPLIREPGTAAGGMREISAASLVFAQAPALGVLALAALNFAR